MNAQKSYGIKSILVICLLLLGQVLSETGLAEQAAQHHSYLPLAVHNSGYRESTGELDPGFGGDGIVLTDFGFETTDWAADVLVLPDGKILTAGTTYNESSLDFAMARYNGDGSLDTSFGTGGKVTTDIAYWEYGNALALQPDGKILLAGDTHDFNYSEVDVLALLRYNADGSLDESFGQAGQVLSDLGKAETIKDLALQPDGKILVAGGVYIYSADQYVRAFALARFNPDGSLDTSFDGDGSLTTSLGQNDDMAYRLFLQPDGKILLAGWTAQDSAAYFALARYQPDGSLDPSFDEDGLLVAGELSCQAGLSAALQEDGKVVAACGSAVGEADFILGRFNPDGSLDTGFGEAGLVRTDWGGMEFPTALVLQSNGKIIAAGNVTMYGGAWTFVLARYNPDGSLDTAFGYGGQVMTDMSQEDDARALALQWDGKLILAGGGARDFALLRYK